MSKIFLDRTDPTFKVASSNATIYGANGNQIVTIDTGVANIVIDANVEGIQFAGVTSDYKFKQTGNALEIYSSASALITTIGLQDDTNGTQLTFSDGTLDAQFLPTATGLFLKVGTAIISNTTPTAISNGNNVAVNASNTMPFDASAGNVHFTVAEGNYTYSIANFGKGDVLQFPKASTATVSNPVGTDGTVTLQYANNGNIAVVNLSGLTAAQDTSVYSLKSFQDLFGASSIANTGTGAVVDLPVTPVGQPPVGQPPVEQPPVEQPHVEQPHVEQPHVGQPPVGQPPVVGIVSVTLSSSATAINEGAAVIYTATLSNAAPAGGWSIPYTLSGTANFADYTTSTGNIFIAAGATTGTLVLNAVADNLTEGTETVIVTLGSVAGLLTAVGYTTAVTTIIDTSIASAPIATPVTVIPVTGGGTTDAATGNLQFNVTPGEYTYTIANFASGDVLHFPAGNAPQVSNFDYTDHKIDVTYESGSTTTHLVLTGLTGVQEFIGSVNSFNSTFGAGSII